MASILLFSYSFILLSRLSIFTIKPVIILTKTLWRFTCSKIEKLLSEIRENQRGLRKPRSIRELDAKSKNMP